MHDLDRTQFEYEPEEGFETGDFEFEANGYGAEFESPFSEGEEMELASELLEITSDAELDQFLGKLLKKAGRFSKSGVGRTLGGMLKGVAKKALPILGTAAGGFFGGPLGASIGGKLAAGAGKLFGLELEGLSEEDQEFEVARRYVRLAGVAAQNAGTAPPTVPPETAARNALIEAARVHAPGLLRTPPPPAVSAAGRGERGRWIRRGNKIILLGV